MAPKRPDLGPASHIFPLQLSCTCSLMLANARRIRMTWPSKCVALRGRKLRRLDRQFGPTAWHVSMWDRPGSGRRRHAGGRSEATNLRKGTSKPLSKPITALAVGVATSHGAVMATIPLRTCSVRSARQTNEGKSCQGMMPNVELSHRPHCTRSLQAALSQEKLLNLEMFKDRSET